MTKKQLIDQVLVKISGGELNPDVNVWYSDLESILPAFMAMVINEDSIRQKELRNRENRSNRSNIIPTVEKSYAVTYAVDTVFDEDRSLYYVSPPGKLMKGMDDAGFKGIRPPRGQYYVKVSSETEVIGITGMGQAYSFLEYYPSEERIYLIDHSPVVETMLLDVVLNPDSLDDDSELPIADHLELELIDDLWRFFLEQRQIPAVSVTDNNDPANEN